MPELALTVDLPFPWTREGVVTPGFGTGTIRPRVRSVSAGELALAVRTPEAHDCRWLHDGDIWGPLSVHRDIRISDTALSNGVPLLPVIANRMGLPKTSDGRLRAGGSRSMEGSGDPAWLAVVADATARAERNLLSVDGALFRRCGTPVLAFHCRKGAYAKATLEDSADLPEGPGTTCFSLGAEARLLELAAVAAPGRRIALPDHEVLLPGALRRDDRAAFAADTAAWMPEVLRRYGPGMFPPDAVKALRRLRDDLSADGRIAAVLDLARAFGVDTSAPMQAVDLPDPDYPMDADRARNLLPAVTGLAARRAALMPAHEPGDDDGAVIAGIEF
jgi:hypothetical protein